MEVLGRYSDRGDGVFRLPSTSPSEFLEEVERLGLTDSSKRADFKRDVRTKGKVAHTWKGDEHNGVWSRGGWSAVVVNMKGKNPGLSAIRGHVFEEPKVVLINFRGAVTRDKSLTSTRCS